ncbi:MAG: substrate-binding domain-containing protein [Muribaculaceae bacterium]|nr:substrate-binding domain-containing protein [Muribaculaceae bacterium]
MKKYFPFFTLVVLLLTACNNNKPSNTSTSGIAKIACDESFRNILDQEVEVFEYSYPDASIMVDYIDEAAALDSLMHRNVDLIITSRDLTNDQRDILKKQGRAFRSRKIAVDAVAIIVNKENDIDELSMSDLRDIFSGKVARWGEVFPTRLKRDSIKVVFDTSGSGVTHYVKEKFLNGGSFGKNVYAQHSTDDVFRIVQSNKNAIGFIGVSWITADLKTNERTMEEKVLDLKNNNEVSVIDFTDRIKVMAVRGDEQPQGVKPYQAYINDGSYPLFRTIWAIDASAGGTLDHGFFSFLTGVIGQKIILQTGILPAAEPVRYVETVK